MVFEKSKVRNWEGLDGVTGPSKKKTKETIINIHLLSIVKPKNQKQPIECCCICRFDWNEKLNKDDKPFEGLLNERHIKSKKKTTRQYS